MSQHSEFCQEVQLLPLDAQFKKPQRAAAVGRLAKMMRTEEPGDDKVSPRFPKVITDMPEAEILFDGAQGWIAQGENHQLVFFEIEPSAEVPEHSHEYAQWGVVLEGEMELTIDGEARVYGRGQDYVIPSYAKHSAKFLSRTRVMDLFQEKARYRPKER